MPGPLGARGPRAGGASPPQVPVLKQPYSSCNTCFTRARVLSDTIWNSICHPLSGVIYSLACREPSAAR